MSQPKLPRLGKGLEALFPKAGPATGKTLLSLEIESVHPNPFQPRLGFDDEALTSLTHSIRLHGVQQPIVVRKQENGYELVAGERRLRASKLAGLSHIPALVKEVSDQESLQLALIENLQRENLNPVEEAKGYRRLMDEFQLTVQELADVFGKSRPAISNTVRLLNLPDMIQEELSRGNLSAGHARALLSLENPSEIMDYFYQIKSQGLNVREIERRVASKRENAAYKPSADEKKVLGQLADHLGKLLKTKARVVGNIHQGKIEMMYGSEDQLKTICEKLGVI
ncbi:MAG: ParB/RepB/Spo0J family partition protein [Candidatus Margulisiibacteriota bacterium]